MPEQVANRTNQTVYHGSKGVREQPKQVVAVPIPDWLAPALTILGIFVTICGWAAVHVLTIRRERNVRKCAALSFLGQLSEEVNNWNSGPDLWKAFRNKAPNIRHAMTPLLADSGSRSRKAVSDLTNSICGLKENEVSGQDGKIKIQEAVSALENYIRCG